MLLLSFLCLGSWGPAGMPVEFSSSVFSFVSMLGSMVHPSALFGSCSCAFYTRRGFIGQWVGYVLDGVVWCCCLIVGLVVLVTDLVKEVLCCSGTTCVSACH